MLDELEETVAADPVFSLRTLSLANSAFYSQQHEIKTLRGALIVMGADAINNLAASLLARSLHASPTKFDDALWQHCQAVAIAGQMLAEVHGRVEPKQAFAAGLLHDIGIMAIQGAGDASDLVQHAAFGAEIADILGLSSSLSEAIAFHDNPQQDGLTNPALVETVFVANALAARAGYAYDGESMSDEEIFCDLVAGLTLEESDIATLLQSLPERIQQMQGLFDAPGTP